MTLLPVVFPYADETTVSWCSRLARLHTNLACPNFLKMVEISQADIMGLKHQTVERLSNLTGVPAAQILACGPQYAGDHMLAYQGETFGTKFMTRNHTTYCPACLLDDRTEEPNGERVGRLSWMFAPVRVCPRHGISLTQRKSAGYSERFQDMNIVAPSDQDLAVQIEATDEASVSGLQSYVVDRLSGKSGPYWLDAQDVDQAAKACQRLGLHRIHGAFASISSMTTQQLNEAEAVGFEAASQGLDGIYSKGCIHHTDRGSQYCSHDYQKILRQHGFRTSMTGKGNCYDNAAVETFFKTIKAELIWRDSWNTRRQAEMAVFEYINGFYNPRRRHSALRWKSPVAFERKVA